MNSNTGLIELAKSTANFSDPETGELLELGALEYLDIAKQERAVHRAQARSDGLDVGKLHDLYEKARDLQSMRDAARAKFAEPLGWLIGAPFSFDDLRAGKVSGPFEVNPCCAFAGRGRSDFFYDLDGAPVGVIGHSSRTWRECHDFGARGRLQVDALPGSWYGPGVYLAILYTRLGFIPAKRVAL